MEFHRSFGRRQGNWRICALVSNLKHCRVSVWIPLASCKFFWRSRLSASGFTRSMWFVIRLESAFLFLAMPWMICWQMFIWHVGSVKVCYFALPQAQPKKSEKTKRMLKAPQKRPSDSVVLMTEVPAKAEAYLPGLPADGDQPAHSHFAGADDLDDLLCLANLVKGGRCKRVRSHGNFCKQHAHEMKKPERMEASWRSLQTAVEKASGRFDEQQLNMAIHLSLEENEAAKAKRQASIAALKPRLDALGLQRIDTEAHGDCQFLAVVFSAGLPVDPQDFRGQIVGYLKHCACHFEDKISSHFRSFQQYLENMARPHTWGDELTLCAASHLLLRPVVVLSDQEHEKERRFEPPPLIHSSVWGPEVYIVHLNNNHYEATCPLAKPRTKQEHVKREPGNR